VNVGTASRRSDRGRRRPREGHPRCWRRQVTDNVKVRSVLCRESQDCVSHRLNVAPRGSGKAVPEGCRQTLDAEARCQMSSPAAAESAVWSCARKGTITGRFEIIKAARVVLSDEIEQGNGHNEA